ncbi:23606_t:CDS:2, partial [Gigaspora margarita]
IDSAFVDIVGGVVGGEVKAIKLVSIGDVSANGGLGLVLLGSSAV